MIRYNLVKNFFNLTYRIKYGNSKFGLLWSFLNPLFTLLIFTVVFKYILKIEIRNFPLYLYSGIVLWSFVSSNVINCGFSFVKNFGIIQKIKFDYKQIIISEILVNSIIFAINILIVWCFSFFLKAETDISSLVHIPLVLLHVFIISYSLGLLIATLTVFFRDIPHMIEIIINIWFYSSPVFYLPSMIPERFLMYFSFNPVFYSLLAIRKIFYSSDFGGNIMKYFYIDSIVIFVLFIICTLIYRKYQKFFPEYV